MPSKYYCADFLGRLFLLTTVIVERCERRTAVLWGSALAQVFFFFFNVQKVSCLPYVHVYFKSMHIYIYIDCFYFSYDLLESRLRSSGGVKLC